MIDTKNIDTLLKLDDAQLKEKLTQAAKAAGADRNQIAFALSDIKKLRQLASSLTPEMINGLLGSFGEENAKKAADILRQNNI